MLCINKIYELYAASTAGFTKVVQTKSITKVANELFFIQQGVAIQLKNFQDKFDIPLTAIVGPQL